MSEKYPAVHFLAPAFGRSSEVWLHRQATNFSKISPIVVCGDHLNTSIYDAKGAPVEIFPDSFLQARNRWSRAVIFRWQKFLNRFSKQEYVSRRVVKWIRNRIMLDSPEAVLFHYGVSAVKYQELYRSCGVPMLVHFNGFDLSSKLRSEDYARQLREAIPHMAGFVVVANYMRDWLLSNGAEASKIHYIPYGVPVREFKISTNTGNEHCRFLAVGRLTSKKAPEHTIRAFAKCHQAFSNCTLTVIGDGPLHESCAQLVASLGMEDSVTFLGVQTSEQVKLHMSEASVFVQHSITPESGDKEGWPVAIAEAAASGLPIVSTQHASIPEEVIDGETGILVGENDWEAMAQGMLELAKSPDLRQRFGTAARSHISQWDFSNQIGKLEDLVLAISRGPLASPTD